jgi:hypothetical protein
MDPMQASTLLSFPRAERLLTSHDLQHPITEHTARAPHLRAIPTTTYSRVVVAFGEGADLADTRDTVTHTVQPRGQVRLVHFRTWHDVPAVTIRFDEDPGDGIFEETREQGAEAVRVAVEELTRRGLIADGVTLESAPGGLGCLIAADARAWQADAVVFADEDHDGSCETIGLEIRDELLAVAPCPVVIAHRLL